MGTYLVYAIAAGALVLLFLAVGLYIYDFYYGTTSRVDVEQNYNQYQYYQDQAYQNAEQAYPYQQYRSNNDAGEFILLNAIYMMQELYEKFDYNDIDCQKKLICEVLREPEYFGAVAQKAKTGFQWGETIANVITLTDDVSQLVDEYMDASRTSDAPKECAEYFSCPFSIREVLQKHLPHNTL